MVDFSLLRTPDFGAAALGGYQAGQALGRQRRVESALKGINLGRPETLLPVIQADPGSPATAAVLTLMNRNREMKASQTLGDVIRRHYGVDTGTPSEATRLALSPGDAPNQTVLANPGALGDGQSAQAALGSPDGSVAAPVGSPALGGGIAAPAAGQAPALGSSLAPAPAPAPMAAGPQPAGAAPNDEIVVQGHRAVLDQDKQYQNAVAGLAEYTSPSQLNHALEAIGRLDKSQADALSDAQDAKASLGLTIQDMPYEQRRAYIDQHRDYLMQHHVTPEQIDGFDPTDRNLDFIVNQSLKTKDLISARQRALEIGVSQDNSAETGRHNRATEGNESARIGLEGRRVNLEGDRVGIERDRLGLEGRRTTADERRTNYQTNKPPTDAEVIGSIETKRAQGVALSPNEQAIIAEHNAKGGTAGRGRVGGRGAAASGGTPAGPRVRVGPNLRRQVSGKAVAGVPVKQDEPMAIDTDGRPMVVRNGSWVRVN